MKPAFRIASLLAGALAAMGRGEDAHDHRERITDIPLPPPKPQRKPVVKENYDTKARKQGNREMLRRVRQMTGKKK